MKEATRDARGTRFVESLLQDVRYAVRVLRREPGFTLSVILVLGLGIGANVSTFTVLNALLLRSLPVGHPEQLVTIGDPDAVESNWMGSPEHAIVSYPVYQDVRDRNHVLSGVYASGKLDDPNVIVPASGGAVEHPQFRAVTGNFFDVLQVPVFIGRAIEPDDDRIGAGQPVIVISHGYWQRRFGGEPDAIGRVILVNGVALTIVGVTPAGFSGDVVGRNVEGWIPIAMEPQIQPKADPLNDRTWSWLQMMGRLAPGVTLARARNELSAIEAESIRSHTTGDELTSFESDLKQDPIRVDSGRTGFSRYRGAYGPALAVLLTAVALIVLIVSANVANLMLVRGVARAREMTVRMTLGAGRARLV
jgi:predicted permease